MQQVVNLLKSTFISVYISGGELSFAARDGKLVGNDHCHVWLAGRRMFWIGSNVTPLSFFELCEIICRLSATRRSMTSPVSPTAQGFEQ